MNLRLIHDPPAAGTWNMAVDEMMLEAASSGQGILRFYSWNEPTLSLGYFQSQDERRSHVPSQLCPIVRRSTGGGAIVHDQELTYSVAMPLADRWSPQAAALYDLFHASLVRVLSELGAPAELEPATIASLQSKFLCFERRAKGDVVVAAHKVAGSAQRRRRGGILQHGSVVLAASNSAPEIMGLRELSCAVTGASLAASWARDLGRRSDFGLISSSWTNAEVELAQEIQGTRFANSTWLTRRAVMNHPVPIPT